ncbi:monocarboxylate transporter 2-like isoform X1 [Mercenaria mercenaria]|uniref:monocarboxylate transporter 2-like isoform X1 n=1 Tax=Mercenaria mercenaria TaxID=6596 RepID=UPI00234E84C1|nr:monocarboxylate transporter 2-like isoform X1 [Mercenaria mercenaria]XP_053385539.1 monocarboxylate transporter 2-like isoform X1 [Mercenaria mercenaria]
MVDCSTTIRRMDRVNKFLLMSIACIVTIINMGLVFSFGSLFVALMEKFQTDRSTTAAVQSLLVGVTLSFGVVSGILISRIGITLVTFISGILVTAGFCMSYFAVSIYYLYVSIGVVSATGISMAFISSLTIAGQMFTGTESLVFISILNTSISVGALIYPFFLEWLQESYGLLGTYLILGGITCNTFTLFVICYMNQLVVKESASKTGSIGNIIDSVASIQNSKAHSKRKKVRYFSDLISVPYLCLLFAVGFSVAALNGYVGLMLDISMWKGFSDSQGLLSMEVYHLSGIIPRFLPAVVKYKTNISVFVCAIISGASSCIGQLILYVTSSFIPYVIGTCLSGIAIGGILSSSLVLIVEIVRQQQRPLAYGLLYTVDGILSTAAGYLLGKFRDVSDSYASVVLTVFGSQLLATILFCIAFASWKHKVSKAMTLDSKEADLLTPSNLQNGCS